MALIDTYQDPLFTPLTYALKLVFLGVVLTCLPSVGVALVRPCASYVDKMFACYISSAGATDLGGGVTVIPAIGDLVQIAANISTRVGVILQVVSSDRSPLSLKLLSKILHYDWNKEISDLHFILALKVFIQDITDATTSSSPGQLTLDSHAGDIIIGLKKGPKLFCGVSLLIVKGSGLAYTEYSALDNSIITVAQNYEFDSFVTKVNSNNKISKHLVSRSVKLGLGVNLDSDDFPITISGDKVPLVLLQYKYPIYRHQQFLGGLPKGCIDNVLITIDKLSNKTVVASTLIKDYIGNITRASIKGLRSLKTPNLISVTLKDTSDSILVELPKDIDYFDVDQPIVFNKYIKDLGTLGMLNTSILKLLKLLDVTKSKLTALNALNWQKGKNMAPQYAPLPDLARVLSNQKRVFNNCSFLFQLDDGAIVLKDGWGSLIRMFGGNIYISPALDVFMRPGRDFMTLVPRNALISTGNLLALASHKNIDIAAGENAKIASGVLDLNGFTVLLSRCTNKNATGVVIRSNGNMSITSSQDMYIGVNDKTSTNAGDKATKGNGTIRILGSILNLDAKSYLKATAGIIGLYGYNGGTGSGITIASNVISTSTNSVLFDASNIIMGGIEGLQKVVIGNLLALFTLTKGSDNCNLIVKGQFRCQDTILKGRLIASGQIVGSNYIVLNTAVILRIYGMPLEAVDKLKEQILEVFEQLINLPTISYPLKLQTWYNDDYICSKLLKFLTTGLLGFNPESKMPSMCWQIESDGEGTLKPIKVKPTGEGELTFSYPGKLAWLSGKVSTITDLYKVLYTVDLDGGYKTNA